MSVLRAFLRTVVKMFAADLWVTIIAVAGVAVAWGIKRGGLLDSRVIPFVLGAAVLIALGVGVARGARS